MLSTSLYLNTSGFLGEALIRPESDGGALKQGKLQGEEEGSRKEGSMESGDPATAAGLLLLDLVEQQQARYMHKCHDPHFH